MDLSLITYMSLDQIRCWSDRLLFRVFPEHPVANHRAQCFRCPDEITDRAVLAAESL